MEIFLLLVFIASVGGFLWSIKKKRDAEQLQQDAGVWLREIDDVTYQSNSLTYEITNAVQGIYNLPSTERGERYKADFSNFASQLMDDIPIIDAADSLTDGLAQSRAIRDKIRHVKSRLEESVKETTGKIYDDCLKEIGEFIIRHEAILNRKRLQMIYRDEFGRMRENKWRSYVFEYLKNEVMIENAFNNTILFDFVNEVLGDLDSIQNDSDYIDVSTMTPIEFEKYCAQKMEEFGWMCELTKATGDQGSDVIAEKSGVRLVLQCKLYSSPVGNAAVQEAISGREFEGADFAAVVTNSSFTPHARQLAEKANVLLLHHTELGSLEHLIGR